MADRQLDAVFHMTSLYIPIKKWVDSAHSRLVGYSPCIYLSVDPGLHPGVLLAILTRIRGVFVFLGGDPEMNHQLVDFMSTVVVALFAQQCHLYYFICTCTSVPDIPDLAGMFPRDSKLLIPGSFFGPPTPTKVVKKNPQK